MKTTTTPTMERGLKGSQKGYNTNNAICTKKTCKRQQQHQKNYTGTTQTWHLVLKSILVVFSGAMISIFKYQGRIENSRNGELGVNSYNRLVASYYLCSPLLGTPQKLNCCIVRLFKLNLMKWLWNLNNSGTF